MKRFNDVRNKLETPYVHELVGKTIRAIYENLDSIYILFEDNSILALQAGEKLYEDEIYLKDLDIGDLSNRILLQLGLITNEQFDLACELDRKKHEERMRKIELEEYNRLKRKFEGENNGTE